MVFKSPSSKYLEEFKTEIVFSTVLLRHKVCNYTLVWCGANFAEVLKYVVPLQRCK